MFTVFAPLISIGFSIYYGFNSSFKEEEKKYIDIILSTKITRESFLIQKILSLIFKSLIISYSLFFSIVISTNFFSLTINLWNIFSICFYLFLLSSSLGIMTIFFSTLLKKSSYIYGIPSSIAIISYIVYSIEPLINSFKEIKYISLFYFYKGHDPLNNGFHQWYWIIFVFISIIFALMSLYYWRLRDIDT
jgi:ABC-2 type transport system permease protein